MRQLGQVLAVTFAVGGALTHTSAEAVELESFWNHNHSTVALISHGNLLTFFYQAPRPSMRAAGVKEGTLLFSGTRTDDKCSGTAYVFSSRCGPVAYSVIGRIASDSRRITLSGMAPAAFDEECRATDYREDVLYFTFLKNTNDPAQ